MTDIIDVPSLNSFGTFCSRSLQAENVVVMGSAAARKSRIFMSGLDGISTSSANVYTVLESKPSTPTSQSSEFVIKINQGSDNLNVVHETLKLDAQGNFKIFDNTQSCLLEIDAGLKTVKCPGILRVQDVDILLELNFAKQEIAHLKTITAELQAAVLQLMSP